MHPLIPQHPHRAASAYLGSCACACLLFCAYAAHAASATAPPQPPGKWRVSPAAAGKESLSMSLKAEKEVKGWMKSAVPTLTIECGKKKAAVYVETWLPLEITQVDKQIVRVQFDGGKPIPQRWQEITNATIGASARDSTLLVKQLAGSQKFAVQFTPFNSPPVQAEFDVAGLAAYLPQLARLCWE